MLIRLYPFYPESRLSRFKKNVRMSVYLLLSRKSDITKARYPSAIKSSESNSSRVSRFPSASAKLAKLNPRGGQLRMISGPRSSAPASFPSAFMSVFSSSEPTAFSTLRRHFSKQLKMVRSLTTFQESLKNRIAWSRLISFIFQSVAPLQ